MLDLKAIRDDPDTFRTALARRGLPDAVDDLLELDERRRALTTEVEALRAEQNKASKAIGAATGDDKQALIARAAEVSASLKAKEPELADVQTQLTALLAQTPNLPHESVPDGLTEDDAVPVRASGERALVRFPCRAITSRWESCSGCWTWIARSEPPDRDSSICWATSCSCSSHSSSTR